MTTVSVRYIVNDVDIAIAFYCQHLDFREEMHPAPTFAILSRGDLRLLRSRTEWGRWRRAGHARWEEAQT
jgi:catechol 2,3-dioxygenase-like lactoylglutathione lyase family enzyme